MIVSIDGWETNTNKEGEILKLKKNAGVRTSGHIFMLEKMQMLEEPVFETAFQKQ